MCLKSYTAINIVTIVAIVLIKANHLSTYVKGFQHLADGLHATNAIVAKLLLLDHCVVDETHQVTHQCRNQN